MKKIQLVFIVLIFGILLVESSCSYRDSVAILGATTGAVIGSVLDNGGVGGKLAGALIGGSVANLLISSHESNQILPSDIQMSQTQINQSTDCRKVTTNKWEGGKLIFTGTEEVCDGHKSSSTY